MVVAGQRLPAPSVAQPRELSEARGGGLQGTGSSRRPKFSWTVRRPANLQAPRSSALLTSRSVIVDNWQDRRQTFGTGLPNSERWLRWQESGSDVDVRFERGALT
jgi:hypothetical protein